MGFLDMGGFFGGDADGDVDEFGMIQEQSAPALTGQKEGLKISGSGGPEGLEDIFRITRGGNTQKSIAGLPEALDLPGEDMVKAVVIGAGGDGARISAEGECREGRAVVAGFVADDELCSEVLGVGGRAAISGDEELMAFLKEGGHAPGRFEDFLCPILEEFFPDQEALAEVALNNFFHREGAGRKSQRMCQDVYSFSKRVLERPLCLP